MDAFWHNQIINELTRGENKKLFSDPLYIISEFDDTIKIIEKYIEFPERLKQFFKNFFTQDEKQLRFFSEKLKILLNESSFWKTLEYTLFQNPSYNFNGKEEQETSYMFVCEWIKVKSGEISEEELLESKKTKTTVLNYPQYFIADVQERIKDLPFVEKLKYIQNIKHSYDLEIRSMSLEELLSNNSTRIYESDFIIKCDAELAHVKKMNEIEILEQKQLSQVANLPEINIVKNHFARSLFFIIETLSGEISDKTTIAKFLFYLANGKESKNRNDYHKLLNAISAENKKPNIKTEKAMKDTILQYLKQLNLID